MITVNSKRIEIQEIPALTSYDPDFGSDEWFAAFVEEAEAYLYPYASAGSDNSVSGQWNEHGYR